MTYFDLLFFYVSKVRFFRFLFVLFPVDVVPQDVPDSVHTQLASSTVKPTTTRNKIQIFDPTKRTVMRVLITTTVLQDDQIAHVEERSCECIDTY